MMRILEPVMGGMAEMLTEAEGIIKNTVSPDGEAAKDALRDITTARTALQDAKKHFLEGTKDSEAAGNACLERSRALFHRAVAAVECEVACEDTTEYAVKIWRAWLLRCPVQTETMELICQLLPKYGAVEAVIESKEFREMEAAIVDASPEAIAWLCTKPPRGIPA